MMVSSEGDTVMEELKGVVTNALEKKGILAKIRAELRASVFEAIDEQGSATNTGLASQRTEKLQKLQESEGGLMVTHLVHEFLEWCGLDYTLKVYTPEAGTGIFPKRSELETTLDLGTRSSGKPLLVEILEQFRSGAGGARPEVQTPDAASGGARQGGAVSSLRAASASSDRSPSPDESPSPDIFARARRSAGNSSDKGGEGKVERVPERRKSPRASPRTSPRDTSESEEHRRKSKSPVASPTTSGDLDAILTSKELPSALSNRPTLAPLGGGSLPPLRVSSGPSPLTSPSDRFGHPKSPSERSDASGLGLNRSTDFNRSLELGRSADFSDHYSADFDDGRDIDEELESELSVAEEIASADMSDDSFHDSFNGNPSFHSDGGASSAGRRAGMSMDMMASGLSASDRSGDLDLLDLDEADHIESAQSPQ
mmetsp:Transcript_39435/g.66228  ORF Transcript_39435/g.66228 Transcript_39435/m.66228 type:complete len:428 (+) Transcript_39435:138-1421(+)|eukprot:CAMPEP_0198199576 /NCGR_PEP_ID=MMETSP1445-20131203/2835_1 /TAXON_ID=36898 /ORGANISM="Pyramimonas sp., Strain CCMP2087" /LENGTH=427 /DNA_ID=CAMNT_0043869453 /DNA_START=122 /DNA_END=1405 /DNA_ORIENTATION=+